MAIRLTYHKHGGESEFIVDGVEDIPNLPTTSTAKGGFGKVLMGSSAYVIDTGETYHLRSTDVWVKPSGGTSGGDTSALEGRVAATEQQLGGITFDTDENGNLTYEKESE